MVKLSSWKTISLLCVLSSMAAIPSRAQTFSTLYTFCSQPLCDDGREVATPLIQGADGNLYGTTAGGGTMGQGTAFKITTDGTLTTLHAFCTQTRCLDGSGPQSLVLATDGAFYGTTYIDGAFGGGTVFRMTPSGNLKTIYNFCTQPSCTDGRAPQAGLVQGADGNLYGTTYYGGAGGNGGSGTVFKITPAGQFTTLCSFCSKSNCTDGATPRAALIQGADGNFYGTTLYGGANHACGVFPGCGTIFKITPTGSLTTLYSFCAQSGCSDGELPEAGLIQGTDGNFYGTTGKGTVKVSSPGTVFRITPGGTLTTIHSFAGGPGVWPYAGIIQATDRNFYGTNSAGGANGWGTIFEVVGGVVTGLFDFDPSTGTYSPWAALFQATNGAFYGTTNGGDGAVYSLTLSPPLGPFVLTIPTSGRVGTKVTILGNNLTGVSSVTFNGTAAAFTVNSTGTAITTAVPGGATSGFVKVTAPGGTLTSNVKFRVP